MDPITIGLAFSAAQAAVGHIKQAIALGKDVHGLVGQFSKFFDSADTIHRAKARSKASFAGMSNAELQKMALQTAMHSDALRQQERELKDMIIWQLGKPQIWEDMIKERVRLFKERAEEERAAELARIEQKKKNADQAFFALCFMGGAAVLFSAIFLGIQIYGSIEDKRIYEEKVAQRNLVIRRQAQEREKKERDERDKAVAGG